MKLNIITAALWVIAMVWLVIHRNMIDWTPEKLAGAAIAAVASVFLMLARIQLGGSFSVLPEARGLVTNGLYAKIRNPIYVFSAMFLLGVVMISGHWQFALVLLVLVPMQIYRARQEERVLHQAYGEEYARYKGKTWF